MKYLPILLVLTTTPVLAQVEIYSSQGKYLGNLSTNKYEPRSINNPYGQYGNRYNPNSVRNPYGRYGSKYSPYSWTNPYATSPPRLYTPYTPLRRRY